MGRNLRGALPAPGRGERAAVGSRHQEPAADIEGLRELRKVAGKAQADIASALNITQPSVSKIEKQNDMHLSTLRSYVEAVGGELQLTVKLPERPALRIHHLGVNGEAPPKAARRHPSRAEIGDIHGR